jgi:hypothetical protein
MGNHKRGKAKNQRAGCLMCKPHKVNGAKRHRLGRVGLEKVSEMRRAIEFIHGDRNDQEEK